MVEEACASLDSLSPHVSGNKKQRPEDIGLDYKARGHAPVAHFFLQGSIFWGPCVKIQDPTEDFSYLNYSIH